MKTRPVMQSAKKQKELKTLNANRQTKKPVPIFLRMLRVLFKTIGRIAPNLAASLAYRLWVHPPRFTMPASENTFLQAAEQTEFEYRENTVVCYEWSPTASHPRGETVLLVHGWSGRGSQLGALAASLTQAGYLVISFDAPAHGKSSGSSTNIYEIADVIIDIEQRYGHFDAAITHSFGGPCIATALKHGLETRCVVNISPPSTVTGLVDKFCNTLQIPNTVKTTLLKYIENRFGQAVWAEASMKNIVRAFDLPALVIHDADDSDVSCSEGREIASAWQNAEYFETQGLGHRRILKDGAVIQKTIDFVNEQLERKDVATAEQKKLAS